ncbi:hypothetical protein EWM64_g6750 [Hericium alpestre]|uniref:Reverse transcriptase Ty1/copia-type domain-containing protein n=1 Tax=Hericium alpestre TaxID=135208 RepID=A0A4Y9ZTA6_9AGAM|nr:hypothetical protein EWM64_g6750 [Hericium alpestre]
MGVESDDIHFGTVAQQSGSTLIRAVRWVEYALESATHDAEGLDPKTLKEAKSRSDWPMWKEAMEKEMASLKKANTWTTVEKPPGKNVVGCKWVFRIKKNAAGEIEKYKARLVAKGFTQIEGVDYFDTYSPVAKLSNLRAILALAARYGWDIETFDFNSAFLNGTLDDDEEIYMQEPPGYEEGVGNLVKKLLKSIYGLKQAGRKWYDALCRALADLGFQVTKSDPGVFYARVEKHIIILAIHVDDCAMTGSSPKLLKDFKEKLNEQYALTDLGPIHWLLGIKVIRDRAARTISLSQTSYIDAILTSFNFTDAKPLAMPMTPGLALSKDDCPETPADIARMKRVPYREAIGSLMYASVATRPDISFAVSLLSQFLDNPGEAHWEAVKRVFSRIRRLTHAAKEGIWLRHLLGEIFTPFDSPTTLYCDNQAAIKLATTDNFHARTKYIDIRYHFIRYVVDNGTFKIIYCPTEDMTADIFTKALPNVKVKHFASALGLRSA